MLGGMALVKPISTKVGSGVHVLATFLPRKVRDESAVYQQTDANDDSSHVLVSAKESS
jgi:hypothetical protein